MDDGLTNVGRTAGIESLAGSVLSRRTLLGKALAAGIMVPALSLLAACGEDEPESDADEPGGQPNDSGDEESGEPVEDESGNDDEAPTGSERQRGGTVRIATRGSANTFDPHFQVVVEETMPIQHIYSGLTRATVEMEAAADLAVSWESNETGDEWTFQLRPNVRFHNGREFEASDVVETFNRILDPELGSQFASQLEMISEVEAPDLETAIFHLGTPYGAFAELLANYFPKIIPIEEAGNLESNPVGTGPYVLDRHIPAERTVLSRFEEHWDSESQGFVDEIHFIHMGEETTRMTAVQGGNIDLIVDISASSVPMVEGVEDVVLEEVVTGSHLTVIMAYDEEPWTDQRVRTALKLCLDREGILQAAVQGYGVTAADQPTSPIDPMYPDLPIPEQDIERAKELLADAGYPDGIDLELHTSPGRVGMQEVALAVQEMAEPAGFRIEVQSHPIDQYWADIWMQVPFHMSNWNARLPSDQTLQLVYTTGVNWNESQWANEEFDNLVKQAQQAVDPEERFEFQYQASKLLAEEGPVSIPIFRSGLDVRRRRLRGYEPHPLRWAELHRCWVEEA